MQPSEWLGTYTEKLFEAAFADAAIINAGAAASLLGMDVKTLKRLCNDDVIRSVRRGKLPAFTERDLREYLVVDIARPAPRGRPAAVPAKAQLGFTEMKARGLLNPQKKSTTS
jgi:hypothetical protein